MDSADNEVLWERHAAWWQREFSGGADPEYEDQVLPLVGRHLGDARRVLDIGCGEGQVARHLARLGVEVTGLDPTPSQVSTARDRAGGPRYARARADALPCRTGAFEAVLLCLALEHVDEFEAAISEVARVVEPGGRFVLVLCHPLLQAPGSGWIDDRVTGERYWRIREYLRDDTAIDEVAPGISLRFIHRPLSRYVHAMGAAGLVIDGMEEPPPPPRLLAELWDYAEAATIPRVLLVRALVECTGEAGILMGAVGFVTVRRLARQWRALVAAGILLGLAFGLCLASVAAARRTASAYDRVLAAADAPDAAVGLRASPESGERSLAPIAGITRQRVYAGFVGAADGLDRALATALIAPIRDRFPLEHPQLQSGRLPDQDAPDEVIVNTSAAARGDLEVGQRLHFRLIDPASSATTEADVEIVGIGTFPLEIVADETMVLGVFVFTRAFYDAHRDFVVYAVSNVDLARGFDARRDLAPAIGTLGHQLQSARTQEQATVSDSLRPLVIVLVAIGLLAFGAAAVATGQVVMRTRDRWRTDNDRIRTLGMARGQILMVELATASLVAGLGLATVLATMVLASPLAPIGPLHDHDPGQGFGIDPTVAAIGAVIIVATILLITVVLSSVRTRPLRPTLRRSPWFTVLPGNPATVAGLTLALRTDDGRGRGWRSVAATTAATTGLALCAVFVASAVVLIDTPADYGFDADLVALNPYGDQAESALQQAFGGRDDVVAATGFTTGSFVVDGRAVPGVAATPIKGELTPTILEGRPARAPDEIVVGADTLDTIVAEVGDVVPVRLLSTAGSSETTGDPVRLRIVGVATFPAVSQLGTDMPRLGVGALVTRDAFLRMRGDPDNQPEFTTVRLTDGTDPTRVIATNTDGFQDAGQTATTWFTDTKPAELVQLDAATTYLFGALIVGFAILLAVFVHALWTRVHANRHDLAVLRVVGCSRRQLDAITAWQAAPFAVGAGLLGIPLGIALGRFAFRRFAQSLAVVDDVAISGALIVALVAAVVVAAVIADLVAVAGARRTRAAAVLREV